MNDKKKTRTGWAEQPPTDEDMVAAMWWLDAAEKATLAVLPPGSEVSERVRSPGELDVLLLMPGGNARMGVHVRRGDRLRDAAVALLVEHSGQPARLGSWPPAQGFSPSVSGLLSA